SGASETGCGGFNVSSAKKIKKAKSGLRAEPVAIWKARKFIEEHSTEELSLTKIAKAVHMNANYLSENFKQVTGINFVEYVARTRFDTAGDLLRTTDMPISEIAFAAGFQSLSQFNRVFKRFSGKSPTQYRWKKGRPRRHQ
ncbi:MAG: helix-turn-helix domain-containing protein, partial [Nitrospirota bacterium]